MSLQPIIIPSDGFQVLRDIYPALSPNQINQWFMALGYNARSKCRFLNDNPGVVNFSSVRGIDGTPVILSRRDIFNFNVVVHTQRQIEKQLFAKGDPLNDRVAMSQEVERLFHVSFASACTRFSLYQGALASLGLISDLSVSDLDHVREITVLRIESIQTLLSFPISHMDEKDIKWRLITCQVQLRAINQEIQSRRKFS
jgi:hypothetical protein